MGELDYEIVTTELLVLRARLHASLHEFKLKNPDSKDVFKRTEESVSTINKTLLNLTEFKNINAMLSRLNVDYSIRALKSEQKVLQLEEQLINQNENIEYIKRLEKENYELKLKMDKLIRDL